MTAAIGVDVGGTKVAAGVVDPAGQLRAVRQAPTPSTDPDAIAELIGRLVSELRADQPVAAVGIGAAGFVAADRATVRFAPNLAWRDEPLRDRVAPLVGVPVVVENDANATAWAEHRFGAGRGQAALVVVTVGTGIGGGLVVDGRLYRGGSGLAGEFGHLRVVPDGRPCGCGNLGCWEQYCSGPALVRAAGPALAAPTPAGRLTGADVTAAARRGDPAAVRSLAVVGGWLGQGLAELTAVLDPGLLLVGGGVADAGELLLGPARDRFAAAVTGRGHRPLPEIRPVGLGPLSGLIGAADLARTAG